MPFKRNIELGRVAYCNYGPDAGQLFVIVDVLDSNRAVVDRPDMVRKVVYFKRLTSTDIKVDVGRLPGKKQLSEACKTMEADFFATAYGQKLMRRKEKSQMSDFDRYKNMVSRCRRSRLVRKAYNDLKKKGV